MYGNGNTNPDLGRVPEPEGPDYDTRHLEGFDEFAPPGYNLAATFAAMLDHKGGYFVGGPETVRDIVSFLVLEGDRRLTVAISPAPIEVPSVAHLFEATTIVPPWHGLERPDVGDHLRTQQALAEAQQAQAIAEDWQVAGNGIDWGAPDNPPDDPAGPRDLDMSDVYADGERMLDELLEDATDEPGFPCTFAGCNGFFHQGLTKIANHTGWVFTPIAEEAEEIIGVHDHRHAFEQGHYLPGWNGKPVAVEPPGPTNL